MKVIIKQNENIAHVNTEEQVVVDVQSALDLMATIRYEYRCDAMILSKSAIIEEFFDLSTRLAGEIVQKYVNYGMKLAIVGDFSPYTSMSLHDYIYECNKGKDIFFVPSEEEAIKLLSKAFG